MKKTRGLGEVYMAIINLDYQARVYVSDATYIYQEMRRCTLSHGRLRSRPPAMSSTTLGTLACLDVLILAENQVDTHISILIPTIIGNFFSLIRG